MDLIPDSTPNRLEPFSKALTQCIYLILMLMYMNNRQHICGYVKFLVLYILVDYSWDGHQKCHRTAIMIKCNTTHNNSFMFAIIWPFFCIPFLHSIQTTCTPIYNFGRRSSNSQFGSVNLFTAKRSCRPRSFLSYHAKFSLAKVAYYRVDLESLHLCCLLIKNCIYWMVVIKLEPILINSIVNS